MTDTSLWILTLDSSHADNAWISRVVISNCLIEMHRPQFIQSSILGISGWALGHITLVSINALHIFRIPSIHKL